MSDEPDWMDPANDRKTPYTEEELDNFVEGFILGLDSDQWLQIKAEYGESEARKIIKAGMIARDERNLVNLQPDDQIH